MTLGPSRAPSMTLFAALVAWRAAALAVSDGGDAVSYDQHSMAMHDGWRAEGRAKDKSAGVSVFRAAAFLGNAALPVKSGYMWPPKVGRGGKLVRKGIMKVMGGRRKRKRRDAVMDSAQEPVTDKREPETDNALIPSNPLEKLGEWAQHEAKPHVEKALEWAQNQKPHVEKALREAAPSMEKALEEAKPHVEKALKEAAEPYIEDRFEKFGKWLQAQGENALGAANALEAARPHVEKALEGAKQHVETALEGAKQHVEEAVRDPVGALKEAGQLVRGKPDPVADALATAGRWLKDPVDVEGARRAQNLPAPEKKEGTGLVPAIIAAAVLAPAAIMDAMGTWLTLPMYPPNQTKIRTSSSLEGPAVPEIQSALPPGRLQSQPEAKMAIPRSFSDKNATIIKLTGLQTEIAGQKRQLEAMQTEAARLASFLQHVEKIIKTTPPSKQSTEEARKHLEDQLQWVTKQKGDVAAKMQSDRLKWQAAFAAKRAELARLGQVITGIVQEKEVLSRQLENVTVQRSDLAAYANSAEELTTHKQNLTYDDGMLRARIQAQIPKIRQLTAQKRQLASKAYSVPGALRQTNDTVVAMQAENQKLEDTLSKLQGDTKGMWDSVGLLRKMSLSKSTQAAGSPPA